MLEAAAALAAADRALRDTATLRLHPSQAARLAQLRATVLADRRRLSRNRTPVRIDQLSDSLDALHTLAYARH